MATISSRLAKCHTTTTCTQDADDRIEYKAADGSTKTMSKAELEEKLRQQQEEGGLPQVGPDGSLSKQKEGKATVEEVRWTKCLRSCVFSIVCARHLCLSWSSP